MKIALDGLGMQSGSRGRGIGRYLRHFTEAVAAAGQPLLVYAGAPLPFDGIPAVPGVEVRVLPAPYTEAIARVAATNPDRLDLLVIGSPFETHAGFTIPDPAQAAVPLAALAYDLIPHLFPVAYLVGDPYADAYRHNLERLLRYPRLLAISDATRSDFGRAGVPAAALATIGAATTPGYFTPGPPERRHLTPVTSAKPFVLYLGQAEDRKNLDGMLDAFALLPAMLRSQTALVVICPAATTKAQIALNQFRVKAGPAAALIHHTSVDDATLRSLYRGCAVFCFPSKYEGFGLPLLEAMQCGAACICGDNSSQPEVAGDAALAVDVTDPKATAQALERLLRDRHRARALGQQAAVRGATFTWERVATRFLIAVGAIAPPPGPAIAPFPEEAYPAAPRFRGAYAARATGGRYAAAKSTAAFCLLARNLGDRVPRLRAGVAALAAPFDDHRIYVYENDSADATALELERWRDEAAGRLWLKCERLGARRWPQARDLDRAAFMAACRNQYHAAVAADVAAGSFVPDYVVVLDSDLEGWSVAGLLSTLGTAAPHWDVMGANGLQRRAGRWTQYDAWAWREAENPEPLAYAAVNDRVYDRGHPPLPLLSCFGGLAVYRRDAFLAGRYAGGDCEHVPFHQAMAAAGYPHLYLNPGMIAVYPER